MALHWTTTPPDRPIIVDIFCGGGGASEGIRMSIGRDPDVAVNHDPLAVAMHKANHPDTLHVCQDIWSCPPQWATKGRAVGLLHASPDCTHFSKAKGGAPRRDQKRRDLPWIIVKWAREVRPNLITMENVEEIQTWGPLDHDGVPIKSQTGTSWRSFIASLKRLGYAVQWRELRACDYGAPTIRKRLFLIARRDGRPIVWPEPTHGPGRAQPYRTAAECIDFSLPCPSIFERKRPLAEATLKRIAEGIKRYVLQAAKPFIVGIDNAGAWNATWAAEAPLTTIITKAKHAVVSPLLVGAGGPVYAGKPVPADRPMNTLMTENHEALVSPVLVTNTSGHAPSGVDAPVATLTTGQHQALVSAFVTKFYSGSVGSDIGAPLHTITAGGNPKRDSTGIKNGLVAVHMQRDFGQSVGQAVDAPLGTITAGGGGHARLVYSFLTKYYGQGGQWQHPGEPMHTIPTKDRMGLVTVTIEGQPYVIADIGLRMLQPRELYRAQGFPDSYIIGDDPAQGLALTKAQQVHMCGNSVCPQVLAAILRANYTEDFAHVPARELPLLAGEGR
jgi:DNA (cytosine-5)-methyltransferase 1